MIKKNKLILPTIGPISSNKEDLKKILRYSDLIRLNGSHNTLDWHKNIISQIKKLDKKVVILFDIPGIKPRTSNKIDIQIKKNQIVRFIDKSYKGKPNNHIKLSNPLPKINSKAKDFTIADGQYSFRIIKKGRGYIEGKSLSGFKLLSNKGLNIPMSIYDDILQEKKYLSFLKKSQNLGYDAVGLSFIQNAEIISRLKRKFPELIFIAKIENNEGLNNLSKICQEADGIMVDRGDLGAEIGDKKLYRSVTLISEETKRFGRPLIMATENFDSMQLRKIPTKSEVMSLGYSSYLGSDKIMLSEETAVSSNWKDTISWLNRFINDNDETNITKTHKIINSNNNQLWNAISDFKDMPFIIFSRSGEAIYKTKIVNPNAEIIAFTDSLRTLKISSFWKDVSCTLLQRFDNSKGNYFVFKTIKTYKNKIFKKNKNAVVLYVSNPGKGSRANTITLVKKEEF